MKRSESRILTTHVGSLARPTDLLDTMKEKENGRSYDHDLYARQVTQAVADIVAMQVDAGVDVVTDGEMSKVNFITYVKDRLAGFEPDEQRGGMAPSWKVEFDDFPEYYTQYFEKYSKTVAPLTRIKCTGPISYVGQELLATDIANLKAAVEGHDVTEVFMPSTGPSGFGRNEYYDSHEEYLHAVAQAMREEYKGIVEAGFVVQIDDPWLIDTLSDPTESWEDRQKAANQHVEAINDAVRDLPADRVRHHTCYGLNHGPRMNDIDLRDVIPFTLKIDAGAYSFEVANPRHMHEYHIWEDVKLDDGKILMPGLLGHANNYVEHPQLIAEYIVHYADLVGRENVIASADCGFSSRASYSPEVHPTVVPHKLKALAEGARLATERLWK